MTLKLSIIVPIYNVEQYLRKCVDSLLAQDISSSEYEIILVDDGSPDGCPQICDEYAQKVNSEKRIENSEFIRVIHRENGGLSAARNSGIEVAQGEYVMFVDSDDYIEPNVLAGLMKQVERDDLDVLRYRLLYVRIRESQESRVKSQEPIYEVYNPYKSDPFKGNDYSSEPTDGVSFLNSRMSTACYAWAFVLKRELLDGCLFTPGIYFEDTDWTPRMLCRAKRVASTNTVVYNYLIREGSITNSVNKSKKKKVLEDKLHLIETLKQQAEDLRKSGRYNRWYLDMIAMTVIGVIGKISEDFYEERARYLDWLNQLQVIPIKPLSLKARLINLSPKIAVKILHWKNRK